MALKEQVGCEARWEKNDMWMGKTQQIPVRSLHLDKRIEIKQ